MRGMSFVLTLAVSVACQACTTIVYVQADNTDTGEISSTMLDSRTDSSGPAMDGTSTTADSGDTETSGTGEPDTEASSTTGAGAGTGTTTEAETSGTTGAGDTTEAAQESTSDVSAGTGDNTTGTTGEPLPEPWKVLGAECSADSECVSWWCSNNLFDDNAPQTCTQPCDPADTNACGVGVCVDVGNNQHRCSGAWPIKAASLVQPPYQGSFFAAANNKPIKEAGVYYVDPQPVSYAVQVSYINNPGYGPAAIDVYTAKGAPLGTAVANAPVIVPPANEYAILVVAATSDAQTLANVVLK